MLIEAAWDWPRHEHARGLLDSVVHSELCTSGVVIDGEDEQ